MAEPSVLRSFTVTLGFMPRRFEREEAERARRRHGCQSNTWTPKVIMWLWATVLYTFGIQEGLNSCQHHFQASGSYTTWACETIVLATVEGAYRNMLERCTSNQILLRMNFTQGTLIALGSLKLNGCWKFKRNLGSKGA